MTKLINFRNAFTATLFVTLLVGATLAKAQTTNNGTDISMLGNKVNVHVNCPAKPSVQVMIMNSDLHVVHNQYFKTQQGLLNQTFDLRQLPEGQYDFFVMIDNRISKKEVTVKRIDNTLQVAMK
jgi:hypothetical protein